MFKPFPKPEELATVHEAMRAIHKSGISVIPMWADTKQPRYEMLPRDDRQKATWAPYQERLPNDEEITRWTTKGKCDCFAAVCGKISGGLIAMDFDVVRFYEMWKEAVGELADGLPLVRTGGDRRHVLFRCPEPGTSDKLAYAVNDLLPDGRMIAIETKGEKGLINMAPSFHASGRRYEMLSGDPAAIPLIPQARADALLAAARKLNEAPWTRQQAQARRREGHAKEYAKHKKSANGQANVIDEFNQRFGVEEMLLSHGYERGRGGMFVRPDSTSKNPSITIKEGRSFHHSTNDALCDGFWHRSFDVFCHFEHGGDCRAAVKDAAHRMGMDAKAQTQKVSTPGDKTPVSKPPLGDSSPSPHKAEKKIVGQYVSFPTHLLPEPARSFVDQGSRAMGADAAYFALPFLVASAAAIGNSRAIALKNGWDEPSVLWGISIGDSGQLKSPSLEAAIRPFRRRQKKFFAAHRILMAKYNEEMKEWRAKPKADRGAEPEPPPPCERTHVGDITIESLVLTHMDAPRGLLLSVDEAAAWIGSFNQYKSKGKGGDVAHWLSIFGARDVLVDRKSAQVKTISIDRAAVSVIGGIQPDVFRGLMTADLFDSGFVARILLADPPKTREQWREEDLAPDVRRAIETLVDGLYALKLENGVDGPEPVMLPLTPAAKRRFAAFVNELGEQQQHRTNGRVVAMWAKLKGYAARLALVIHCLRCVGGEAETEAWHVDEKSVEAGIALAHWFGNEAERIYDGYAQPPELRAARPLIEMIQARGGKMTPRELTRSCRQYRAAGKAEAALDELVGMGVGEWIFPSKPTAHGRPSQTFVLHCGDSGDGDESIDSDSLEGVLSPDNEQSLADEGCSDGMEDVA